MGPSSSQTLCTQGLIHELAVSVLIDSGSSHNIIQPRIAEFLNLPMVAIKPFSVFVGNDQTIQCSGSCLDVPVTLSGQLLGHIISKESVAVDPSKITAILEWAIPKNLAALRGFLGLTGYYRRFVRNYALVAGPLTDLLKKNHFHWDATTQQAFDALKGAITSLLVLVLPDFASLFEVTTDASSSAVGVVLS